MPSFSLPGTSIGTAEAERYLLEGEGGISRAKAGCELLERCVSAEVIDAEAGRFLRICDWPTEVVSLLRNRCEKTKA